MSSENILEENFDGNGTDYGQEKEKAVLIQIKGGINAPQAIASNAKHHTDIRNGIVNCRWAEKHPAKEHRQEGVEPSHNMRQTL